MPTMSRLVQMQARFQQKQMQEKEEKLLRLYENQQQRAFEKVSRSSAGSNNSITSPGGGKVRQMFDERRQKAGVDKSYPLEPLKSKTTTHRISVNDRKPSVSRNTVAKSVVQKTVSHVRNGKPVASKREVVQKVYSNNNGIEHFEEKHFQNDNHLPLREHSNVDLEELMNNHNLGDSLDNEVMPQIGYDEVDNTPRKESASNRRFSAENGFDRNSNDTSTYIKATGGAFDSGRKEQKTVIKTSPKPSTPKRTEASLSSTPRNSTPTTPSKSTMQAKAKVNDASNKAPSANRPSVKQTAKSGVVRDDLAECRYCGRRFASDRLDKHEEVCGKSSKKKRKVYDATKHRVQGTELESYVVKPKKGGAAKQSPKAPKKDWRRTHEEFISTIRAAKQALAYVAKGGKLADLPPPPPSSNPDYVQCPHCGRKFNESAAARHIPKCADYQFNKPKAGTKATGRR